VRRNNLKRFFLHTYVAAVLFWILSSGTTVAGLPAAYLNDLRSAGIPGSAAGLVIAPLEGNEGERYNWNDQQAFNPASTMKLVTSYAALSLLGPDFFWRTEVLTNSPMEKDILRGDLIFRGGGDPKLVIEQLWLLIHRIRAYGIREITGDVILDKSVFAPLQYDAGDFDGEGSRAYNVGPDALLLNFKTLAFQFVPDPSTQRTRIITLPPLAGLQAPASVPISNGHCGDWRSKLRADFSNPLLPQFRGSYPASCGERSWYLSSLDHNAYFSAVFRALWQTQNGTWRGRAKLATTPGGARLIVSHESVPLALMVRDVNKFSNNVMARHLFLALSRNSDLGGSIKPATTTGSAVVLKDWLATQRLASQELVIDNGSGLSRHERIAPATLARLLLHAHRSPFAAEFISSLPISGIDGTLKSRGIIKNAARLKTGLLRDARALAGYVTSQSGKKYILVALLNHSAASSSAAQRAQDQLVNWLYEAG
jgi:serine-type D-Ala-D-Ala carboxypeptidase/endopeptidase (penicillin-binding protein 4)